MTNGELVMKIITVALVVFAVANIALPLYANRHKLGFVWHIWKRFRFKMFLEVLGMMTATTAVTIFLVEFLPFTKWGWLNIFVKGGGNVIIAPVLEASKSSSFLIRILPILFLASLLIAAPFLAKIEEEAFRKGHYEWRKIAEQAMPFGLIHMLVGVPLAVGVALIGAGFFFGYKYRRAFNQLKEQMSWNEAQNEAVIVTTTYHTLYNSVIVVVLLVRAIITS